MSRWHKIEDAPKDGRKLLGFTPSTAFGDKYFVFRWDKNEGTWFLDDPHYRQCTFVWPTHYQELPAPPHANPHNVDHMTNEEFRACRLRMGLTPKELACALGVSQSHIYRMESGPETAQGVNVTRQMTKAIQLLERAKNAER